MPLEQPASQCTPRAQSRRLPPVSANRYDVRVDSHHRRHSTSPSGQPARYPRATHSERRGHPGRGSDVGWPTVVSPDPVQACPEAGIRHRAYRPSLLRKRPTTGASTALPATGADTDSLLGGQPAKTTVKQMLAILISCYEIWSGSE